MISVPVVIVVALIATFMGWAIRRSGETTRRSEANLSNLAGEIGIRYQPGTGWGKVARATGTVEGRQIELFTYWVNYGKSSTTFAAITVRPANQGGLTFHLQLRGFRSKVLELFGAHEIAAGDAEFDATWFVRSNQPDFFRAALVAPLRKKLMAVRESGVRGPLFLNDGVIKYCEAGSFADLALVGRFRVLGDVMLDLAAVAEVAGMPDGVRPPVV
jgi:hypothetical protein